jgi:DNA-binding GntR family transcriptional regulator
MRMTVPRAAYQVLTSRPGVQDRHVTARPVTAVLRRSPWLPVKQLQQEYGVGRDTVLRAVEILRTEGVVFTVPRPSASSA